MQRPSNLLLQGSPGLAKISVYHIAVLFSDLSEDPLKIRSQGSIKPNDWPDCKVVRIKHLQRKMNKYEILSREGTFALYDRMSSSSYTNNMGNKP